MTFANFLESPLICHPERSEGSALLCIYTILPLRNLVKMIAAYRFFANAQNDLRVGCDKNEMVISRKILPDAFWTACGKTM